MKFLSSLTLISAAFISAQAGAQTITADAANTTRQQDQQALQIEKLTQELNDIKAQVSALGSSLNNAQTPAALSGLANVSLWGYGEIHYVRPVNKPENTTADLARAVFGIGYKFDDTTRFNSEFEIEHAVASASDAGEVEVEQFYVDHSINSAVAVQSGLFLIPAGLLNEAHEPTHFYGVQRNSVESDIIPTTWREGGVALHGNTSNGLRWSTGLTTGMNLANWDYAATEMEGAFQATHQELSGANAQHLSQFLALNYQGIPSYTVGASIFTGNAVKNNPSLPHNQRATLWEAHTRWTPGKFDLSALYARGSISHTADANALNAGASNLMPAMFYGYYAQAAYQIWLKDDARISPFVRAEHVNKGAKYEGVAPGFSPFPGLTTADTIYTAGANYYVNANVVFKVDYQKFRTDSDANKINLGVGVAF